LTSVGLEVQVCLIRGDVFVHECCTSAWDSGRGHAALKRDTAYCTVMRNVLVSLLLDQRLHWLRGLLPWLLFMWCVHVQQAMFVDWM